MKIHYSKVMIKMAVSEHARQRFWEHKVLKKYWNLGVPNTLSKAGIWLCGGGRIGWADEIPKYNWKEVDGEKFLKKNIDRIRMHWKIRDKRIDLVDVTNKGLMKYSNVNPGKFIKDKTRENFAILLKKKEKNRIHYLAVDGNNTLFFWKQRKQKVHKIYIGESSA